jgi:hypothetical protein
LRVGSRSWHRTWRLTTTATTVTDGTAASPLRLAVSIRRSVTSDAEEMVPTGGELTLFEAVGRLA